MDDQGRIDRLEDAGAKIASAAGVSLSLGRALQASEKDAMATLLCNCLYEVLERRPPSALTQSLMLTPEVAFRDPIDVITFSGGVSEYIYGFENRNLGDLGNELGAKVRERAQLLPGNTVFKMPEVRIRATVIGASQYTVQVSGNTIFLSHPDLLPLRNLQVITPTIEQRETISPTDVKAAVEKALQRFDLQDAERAAALAIHWEIGPSYPLIRTLAEGVAAGMKEHVGQGHPLVLVFDADIAKLVGNIMDKEILPGCGIISIDGIDLRDFDFIDIGEELPDAKAVPVVIKSLIFRHAERGRGHLLGH
jgi:ethanolamine utilization protein EutA